MLTNGDHLLTVIVRPGVASDHHLRPTRVALVARQFDQDVLEHAVGLYVHVCYLVHACPAMELLNSRNA